MRSVELVGNTADKLKLKPLSLAEGMGLVTTVAPHIFSEVDADGNGVVDEAEFKGFMLRLGLGDRIVEVGYEAVDMATGVLFRRADVKGKGHLDLDAFESLLMLLVVTSFLQLDDLTSLMQPRERVELVLRPA